MDGMDEQGQAGVVKVGTNGDTRTPDPPEPPHHEDTGERADYGEAQEGEEKGHFGGLTGSEAASLRWAQSRGRQTPNDRLRRAIERRPQTWWDAMVENLGRSASGAGVLARLLELTADQGPDSPTTDDAPSDAEKRAVFDALLARANALASTGEGGEAEE